MLPLRHPFTAIVAGPTSCGKTRFVFRLIENISQMIDPSPNKIVCCYVRKCDKEFLDCISECANNVIKGNVPLSNRQKTKLRRNRNDLRALSVKKTSLRKKRRILQKGGFLAVLADVLLK